VSIAAESVSDEQAHSPTTPEKFIPLTRHIFVQCQHATVVRSRVRRIVVARVRKRPVIFGLVLAELLMS